MEELGINQGQGSRAPAETQLLATPAGDSDSQGNIGENSEKARGDKKRESDKRYRENRKRKMEAVVEENVCLKEQIRKKDELLQQMTSKQEEYEAEIARLNRESEEKNRQYNVMADAVGVIKEQQNCINDMSRQFKDKLESLENHVYLNGSQNITQPADTDRCYAELSSILMTDQNTQAEARIQPWTQQQYIAQGQAALPESWTNQDCQATAATPSLSPIAGTSREPQTSPSLETFPLEFMCQRRTVRRVRNYRDSKKNKQEALEDENYQLKQGIQVKDKQEQLLKSKLEEDETEIARLKWEIKEKEQLMKSKLEAFEVENVILMREIEEKEQKMKYNREAFEAKNGRLEHEIEENERLMKSNMEAFEARNGKLKLEIGEKEQPMKSYLESFEAENERLKREIEQKKQLMISNLKAFEAQDGRLEHEIQEKKQLVKSKLETLEVEIRQLVAVNLRMQTDQGN